MPIPGASGSVPFLRDGSRREQTDSTTKQTYTLDLFQSQPIALKNDGTTAASGTAGDTNILINTGQSYGNGNYEYFIIGTQTIKVPRSGAGGLTVTLDATDNDGWEYNFSGLLAPGRHNYVIGTAKPFFMELSFTLADVSGTDECVVGWRKTEACNADSTAYTDYATVGLVAALGDIATRTRNDSATAVTTDTLLDWADTENHKLGIYVDGDGRVQFQVDGAIVGEKGFQFDSGDTVIPFWHFVNATTTPGAVTATRLEIGTQKARGNTTVPPSYR